MTRHDNVVSMQTRYYGYSEAGAWFHSQTGARRWAEANGCTEPMTTCTEPQGELLDEPWRAWTPAGEEGDEAGAAGRWERMVDGEWTPHPLTRQPGPWRWVSIHGVTYTAEGSLLRDVDDGCDYDTPAHVLLEWDARTAR